MRGFTADAFYRMKLQTTGMEFASEMVIKSALLELKTVEVGVTLHVDGRSHPPHLRTWRDGWRHLRFLLLFAPRFVFIVPGALLFILGFIPLIALSFGSIRIGDVYFSVNTHVVASMTALAGFQILSLGLLAHYSTISARLAKRPDGETGGGIARLESGLILGGLFLIIGAAFLVWSLAEWAEVGFGPLESSGVSGRVVLSGSALFFGIQIVSLSFFGAVMRLFQRDAT